MKHHPYRMDALTDSGQTGKDACLCPFVRSSFIWSL